MESVLSVRVSVGSGHQTQAPRLVQRVRLPGESFIPLASTTCSCALNSIGAQSNPLSYEVSILLQSCSRRIKQRP